VEFLESAAFLYIQYRNITAEVLQILTSNATEIRVELWTVNVENLIPGDLST